ncbi:acyl-CoA dehydrogenase family protein [Streptomyces sp. L7]
MYVAIERAKVLAYFSALTIAEDDPRRGRAAAMAKAAAGALAERVCFRNGFQLFGAMGYTWENELQIHLKRAKAGDLLLGTASEHRKALAGMSAGTRPRGREVPRRFQRLPRHPPAHPPKRPPSAPSPARTYRIGPGAGSAPSSTRAGCCLPSRPRYGGRIRHPAPK